MPTRRLSSGLLATSAGTRSFSVSASWYTEIRMLPSRACLRYRLSAGQGLLSSKRWCCCEPFKVGRWHNLPLISRVEPSHASAL